MIGSRLEAATAQGKPRFPAWPMASEPQAIAALVGPGNIGTDLMFNLICRSEQGRVCPPVNLEFNLDAMNAYMITSGGQANTPMAIAVSGIVEVPCVEIVASIASRSAGPGTWADIEEFTETTAKALEVIGGVTEAGLSQLPRDPGQHVRSRARLGWSQLGGGPVRWHVPAFRPWVGVLVRFWIVVIRWSRKGWKVAVTPVQVRHHSG